MHIFDIHAHVYIYINQLMVKYHMTGRLRKLFLYRKKKVINKIQILIALSALLLLFANVRTYYL